MGRMVRKQVYMDERLDHDLAQMAERLKVSQAEVVRRALEAYVGGVNEGVSPAMERLHEWWAEVDAEGAGGWGKWNREELHDRSLARHERPDLRRG